MLPSDPSRVHAKQQELPLTRNARSAPSEPRTLSVPYARHSETSRAAARTLRPIAGTLRHMVFAIISRAGDDGRTSDEVEAATDLRHQTCSARVNELARLGLIEDSGRRRKTRSGRRAAVWVAVGGVEQ